MRIGIVGGAGHGGTAVEAAARLAQETYCGYCPSYAGEDLTALEEGMRRARLAPPRFSNYMELVERAQPDVLVVDSMFCDHDKITAYALRRNIHVYCDKPLALTLGGLRTLKQAARQSKATVWAMQTMRYDPWMYTAHCLMQQQAVGQVRMLHCQKSYRLGKRAPFYYDRSTFGGIIPWIAIHGIDMIRYLYPAQFLTAYARHSRLGAGNRGDLGDLELTAMCMFTMEDEVAAQVQADYLRPESAPTHGDDRVRVVGSEGMLEVRGEQVYLINKDHAGLEPIPLRTPPLIFEDFIHTLQGKGSGLFSQEESFYETQVALLARQSADTGHIVPVG
ncbi:MAG TPA: Gfo/Idh/MocA family oxidoreductase [Candidatus Gallacutalibacter stercoravium]|nr:Gfo/Idh/MocA family oxidoreductase [Candidatus Gallacutalibacter stercoravium]